MDKNKYPLSGFYFNVKFTPSVDDAVSGFKEVSGLEVKIKTKPVTQAGDTVPRYLPKGSPLYKNLVLKRGFFINSGFNDWCFDTFHNFNIKLRDIDIELLSIQNDSKTISAAWHVIDAYPVSWNLSSFNAQKNDVVIESVELVYSHFVRSK